MTHRPTGWRRLAEIRPSLPSAPELARSIALRAAWREVAGAALAARLPALERRGNLLVVGVPHAGWLSSLEQLQTRLAPALRRHRTLSGVTCLVGRVTQSHPPMDRRNSTEPVAATEGDARRRLAELSERLLEGDR